MIDLAYQVLMILYFIAYTFIFAFSFYIAIYNHTLPNWIVTPLWYIGLSSAFINITILLEWLYNENFVMSYSRIGFIGEIAFAASVGVTLGLLFADTVKENQKKVKN